MTNPGIPDVPFCKYSEIWFQDSKLSFKLLLIRWPRLLSGVRMFFLVFEHLGVKSADDRNVAFRHHGVSELIESKVELIFE